MGGASKWNILLCRALPEYFNRRPPLVAGGVLVSGAAEVWRCAHPLARAVMSQRGCFTCESPVPATSSPKDGPRIGVLRKIWNNLRGRRIQLGRNNESWPEALFVHTLIPEFSVKRDILPEARPKGRYCIGNDPIAHICGSPPEFCQ
jgi:hypothetical protein